MISDTERCSNCKFYREMACLNEQWGECKLTWSEEGEPVDWDTLAYAYDTEENSSVLTVKPNFGCVQFMPREQEDE